MKSRTALLWTALVTFVLPLSVQAATLPDTDVLVVVNGNTEVNREAFNFVRKSFTYNNIRYNLTATLRPETVKSGQYHTVVVLNTGVAKGVDPVLKSFIDAYADKRALYLVNLYRGKNDVTVTSFTSTDSELGVDGVSAASTWTGGMFANNQANVDMHTTWVKAMVRFLGRS